MTLGPCGSWGEAVFCRFAGGIGPGLKGLFCTSSIGNVGWALLGRGGGRCICGIPRLTAPAADE